MGLGSLKVSPTSIRSRILKETLFVLVENRKRVSPTSIRSRILKASSLSKIASYIVVSPTSIRSRILKDIQITVANLVDSDCFTHVDPFEDTER